MAYGNFKISNLSPQLLQQASNTGLGEGIEDIQEQRGKDAVLARDEERYANQLNQQKILNSRAEQQRLDTLARQGVLDDRYASEREYKLGRNAKEDSYKQQERARAEKTRLGKDKLYNDILNMDSTFSQPKTGLQHTPEYLESTDKLARYKQGQGLLNNQIQSLYKEAEAEYGKAGGKYTTSRAPGGYLKYKDASTGEELKIGPNSVLGKAIYGNSYKETTPEDKDNFISQYTKSKGLDRLIEGSTNLQNQIQPIEESLANYKPQQVTTQLPFDEITRLEAIKLSDEDRPKYELQRQKEKLGLIQKAKSDIIANNNILGGAEKYKALQLFNPAKTEGDKNRTNAVKVQKLKNEGSKAVASLKKSFKSSTLKQDSIRKVLEDTDVDDVGGAMVQIQAAHRALTPEQRKNMTTDDIINLVLKEDENLLGVIPTTWDSKQVGDVLDQINKAPGKQTDK